jgi:curli production assembly/transport component CsgG|tara:strand:- start:324 stop:1199 length:876 start_codon:yes stop_codon:yes gene_type:complete
MSPRFTEYPQECNPDFWGEEYPHDLLNYAKAVGRSFEKALPFLCVEEPEVVRLPSYIELLDLPPAEEMPVVAVYQFQDKTGQRKPKDNIADFSTAVSQGGVELVIDALKTAGKGKWFRVVERNGLDHLVRERQIIRSARQDFAKQNGEEKFKELNSLLFAGMIIEGGVIGYDTNIKSGGRGARYLGIGATKQYRQDVVTVSMRAVSVLTGEVLLNVQTRKTVLSYGKSGDVFRFIEQGTELVEYEDGIGNNESVTYATRTAIEAGVLELIYQGHRRGFWKIEGYNENEETN